MDISNQQLYEGSKIYIIPSSHNYLENLYCVGYLTDEHLPVSKKIRMSNYGNDCLLVHVLEVSCNLRLESTVHINSYRTRLVLLKTSIVHSIFMPTIPSIFSNQLKSMISS